MENEEDFSHLCVAKWESEYNFVRNFYCSLKPGHDGEHKAYWEHDVEDEEKLFTTWE